MRVQFNVDILNALLYAYPDRGIAAKSHFPSLEQWINDEQKPTVNQLESLAHFFQVPFGYFFLPELPQKEYPIPHFRTQSSQSFTPSADLMEVVETLKERQQWARDTMLDWREDKLTFANRYTVNTPIPEIVQAIRNLLSVSGHWAQAAPSWTDAFRYLTEKAEAAGIFVVMNGVVNNSTRRKLNVNEFRGFVLYDDYAPFVFINNNDAVSAKIFTLVHEIVHILLGKSASFDLTKLEPAQNDIEQYCNAAAAEFLVPGELLQNELQKTGPDYDRLARTFRVSQLVIARRLLDLKTISRTDFFAFYDKYINREEVQREAKGGNFYNTVPYRISKRFFNLIYSAVKQNKMLYSEAFRLTNLKGKTFDQYVKKHLG